MGSLGPIHWIIVAVVVMLVFGGRMKLSAVMGDAAQGLRAFREGLKDETAPAAGNLARVASVAESNGGKTVR
ncbi:MAG: twin-arginine translocation protein TatA/E family subunit [Caulobacteraceae bacterium]|nr:twin-arginine translocation protein TatA/E family subunit [Caulobacteraceae bacterium]